MAHAVDKAASACRRRKAFLRETRHAFTITPPYGNRRYPLNMVPDGDISVGIARPPTPPHAQIHSVNRAAAGLCALSLQDLTRHTSRRPPFRLCPCDGATPPRARCHTRVSAFAAQATTPLFRKKREKRCPLRLLQTRSHTRLDGRSTAHPSVTAVHALLVTVTHAGL